MSLTQLRYVDSIDISSNLGKQAPPVKIPRHFPIRRILLNMRGIVTTPTALGTLRRGFPWTWIQSITLDADGKSNIIQNVSGRNMVFANELLYGRRLKRVIPTANTTAYQIDSVLALHGVMPGMVKPVDTIIPAPAYDSLDLYLTFNALRYPSYNGTYTADWTWGAADVVDIFVEEEPGLDTEKFPPRLFQMSQISKSVTGDVARWKYELKTNQKYRAILLVGLDTNDLVQEGDNPFKNGNGALASEAYTTIEQGSNPIWKVGHSVAPHMNRLQSGLEKMVYGSSEESELGMIFIDFASDGIRSQLLNTNGWTDFNAFIDTELTTTGVIEAVLMTVKDGIY